MAHRSARSGARWVSLACILVLPTVILPAKAADSGSGPPLQPVVASLPTPGQPRPAEPEPAPLSLRVLTVERGDTLTQLLAGAGIETAQAEPALDALTSLFPARSLQPGQALTLRLDTEDGDALLGLDLEAAPGRVIHVSRTATGWTAKEKQAEQYRHLVLAQGKVRGALVTSLEAAGLPASLAARLVRLLAHEVDFQRDLQPTDRFTVLFERFRDADGTLLRDGDIVHAELLLSDRHLSLWRYETEAGVDWYDDEGRSLRRAFLRTPLDGARLSSGFGMRQHPILGFTRMHHGVDFAAPTGTPVYAAADGIVEQIGTRGGYGRTVMLRHNGRTETLYAHLSAYARGLKRGSRVRQGQVIGRVGTSGRSTGPHLHYEIRQAGKPVNPSTATPKAMVKLQGRDLVAFLNARNALQTQLAHLAPMEEVAWAE